MAPSEEKHTDGFSEAVGHKADRKIDARAKKDENIWFSLGMMGLVGWSVAIPTITGALLGRWMDARWGGRVSWTLTMIFAGVAVGCLTAWHWVNKESRHD